MLKPSQQLSKLFNETHLAVVSGSDATADGLLNLSRGEFQGTAFSLGPHLALTALHVYRAAAANGPHVAVGQVMASHPEIRLVSDVDEFPLIDLAILKCPGLQIPTLRFDFSSLDYLSEVAAMGFPFGLTLMPDGPHVQILRAFKGHVVTRRGLTELSGLAPPGYETSFVPPPGLSGAPLLSFDAKVAVRGVILREHAAHLPLAEDRKMTLGLALDIEELLTLDSKLVGGSVAEKIFRRPRIPPRDGTP